MQPQVSIRLPGRLFPVFHPLLYSGVEMPIPANCSVKEFLCRQLNLELVYIENRIQTIFLNGRAVDDLEQAMVTAGSTLALSAAMPGLVGACFRRSGTYSLFRSNVTFQEGLPPKTDDQGRVTVKLFNLIAGEAGPAILEKGVYLPAQTLLERVQTLSPRVAPDLEFHLNDEPVTALELSARLSKKTEVLLRVLGTGT